MDSSENSIESGSMDQSQSTRGLLSYFQRSSSSSSITNPIQNESSSILSRSRGIPASMVQEHRKKTKSDVKRIMATAKAIADDDTHPNQEDVSFCFICLFIFYHDNMYFIICFKNRLLN